MASQEPPLDEIQWRSPPIAASMQGIHSNSVLFYFANSPFYDPTSNNAILTSQAMFNQNMLPIIQTREAFEGRLRTMNGLEFIVAQEPAEMAPGTGTGVWVIRKQTRRKRPSEDDEIIVHATYFVVGENIYMAPTAADVLGSGMLSVLSSLNKFISTAAALPDFSPALGHTYIPPTTTSRLKSAESQLGQTSKENTPLPDSLQSKKSITTSNNSTYLSSRLLEHTLDITLKYGDEYMDENPITGQPGEFHLSSTGRKEAGKLAVPAAGAKGPLSLASKATPTPPALKTDIPPARKGSKSKESPKTPGTGGPPKPKRRKSKALVSGGGSSAA
ncbi:mediator of RNA polymeras-like protein II transcription subunit 6 [Hyaloscypha variabilis F]|uniref:Mediator of RNA polymerase II transcription subunit 6 n=1 Tax=Hyaloscypha variabilis (strain UAMH 11265 / GT02V1 / F) TaxID=1149755 RepID=A0A2J6RWV5_HYAVF|nr:mediator of RNA polymeras-like protein II transcription subunit 6 [Hyaloscypha variabilis F]